MALFGRREKPAASPPPPSRPLPVPPFAPDPPTPAGGPPPFAGDDPAAVLAAHGVVLPGPLETHQASSTVSVWTVQAADGDAALALWRAVRGVHDRTGLWPVAIDPQFWETTAFEGLEEDPEPVTDLDAVAFLGDRWRWHQENGAFPRGEAPAPVPADPDDWHDLTDDLQDADARVLLVPATAGWAVPGVMGWSGGVNAGIEGDEHQAVLRRWSVRWGAELVTMGLDTIGLRVSRPPTSPDDVLATAVEMALYCPDAVFQGAGTVDALTAMAGIGVWGFWWD